MTANNIHLDFKRERGDILINDPVLWNIYARTEEADTSKRDEHNRFEYRFSDNPDACNPVVSRYLCDNGLNIRWQDDKDFAICLTHDVDEIYVPFIHKAANAAYLAKRSHLLKSASWALERNRKGANPYWNFDKIMKLEEDYGATSSFYFKATDKDPLRFRYHIEDLEGTLGKITDAGWEVGLHGGYYTYNDPQEIANEKGRIEKVLGKKVVGYRNHYLRMSYLETLEYLEKAVFLYDTTLGWAGTIGFRNGMCHPYHPWNGNTDSLMNILEIPMGIMDGPLFGEGRNFATAWELTKKLIDTVAELHGVLCVNWHTNDFNCPFKYEWEKMYEKILEYGKENNAWMTSGENIYKQFE